MKKTTIVILATAILLVGGIFGFAITSSLKNTEKNLGLQTPIFNSFSGALTMGSTTTMPIATNLPVKVLSANSNRQYAAIVNDSSSAIYLILKTFSGSAAASTTAGSIRINSNGGSYEILPENNWLGDVWATSTAASAKILYVEK